jgi:peptidyl-prolyl cis-trans isomerase C
MSTRRWLRAIVLVALVVTPCLAGAATKSKKSSKSSKSTAKTSAPRETVLVRVGKEAITPRMVQARIDELPEQVRPNFSTPEGRQRLLDRMVEEKVWLQTAEQKGVPQRPEVRQQLEQSRRDLLIRTYITEMMASNPAPSDAEAQAYYDAHQSEFRQPATVTLSHIQLKDEKTAQKVLKQAKAGKPDWKTLVEKSSTDSLTRKTGGALGTVTREGIFAAIGSQPALAESAFKAGTGAIGGPWRTERGWHIVKVDNVKPESVRPLEAVRGQILRTLGSKKSQDYYQSQLDAAKKSLNVKPDSAAIKNFVSQRKTAREMFNEAQSAGAPGERISGYRKVLADYPDSDVSPQAQFMIGFIQSEELKDYDAADASFKELIRRYPKSELVPSAKWMVDHMRKEDAPSFMNLAGDSSQTAPAKKEAPHTP